MVESIVTEIGEMADFGEPVVILFDDSAPVGLRDVCVMHKFKDTPNREMLTTGSKIQIGETEYTVQTIGGVANETLFDLGHISLYFDLPEDEEVLPGAVSLSPSIVPKISIGDHIKFIK